MSKIESMTDFGSPSPSNPTVILAHSIPWQAALKRTFQGTTTVWALDENDLVAEAIRHPTAAVVFELPHSRGDQLAVLKPLFGPRRRIFVVGDDEIRSCEAILRGLGIVDVFYAPADLSRLIGLVKRHNQTCQGPPVPLEIEIERQLPWS